MKMCPQCGKPLGPQVGRGGVRKFCLDCSPPRARSTADGAPIPAEGEVSHQTRALLDEAGRLASPLGAAALVLARRLDADQDSGTGLAALAKQLGATLETATAGVPAVRGKLADLRAQVAAHRVPPLKSKRLNPEVPSTR